MNARSTAAIWRRCFGRTRRWIAPLLLAGTLGLGAPAPRAAGAEDEPLVFAAASLAGALEEIGETFAGTGGGTVAFNFAASNDLARQILAGAPADLFLSANREQLARLEPSGRVRPQTARAFLGNTLVVVVPAGDPQRPVRTAADLLSFDRLALADPSGVPAGIYARQWLEQVGLWQQLEPRIVPAFDARAAVAAVAAGNLPAGIVYATDALAQQRVRVVYQVPPDQGPQVRYWSAPIAGGSAPGRASAFLEFLGGEQAGAVFRRYGFAELPSE